MLPILARLKLDESEYVRRSVANHLGDIAKDHPELVVETLAGWLAQTPGEGSGRTLRALARHAVRHLVKEGHVGALALLGFAPGGRLRASLAVTPGALVIGESVELSGVVTNDSGEPASCAIDYVVSYPGKGAGLRRKVFKLAEAVIVAGGAYSFRKGHPMRSVSIRALFPG